MKLNSTPNIFVTPMVSTNDNTKRTVDVNPQHVVSIEELEDGRYYLRTTHEGGWYISAYHRARLLNQLTVQRQAVQS